MDTIRHNKYETADLTNFKRAYALLNDAQHRETATAAHNKRNGTDYTSQQGKRVVVDNLLRKVLLNDYVDAPRADVTRLKHVAIRDDVKNGATLTDVMATYNVSRSTVRRALKSGQVITGDFSYNQPSLAIREATSGEHINQVYNSADKGSGASEQPAADANEFNEFKDGLKEAVEGTAPEAITPEDAVVAEEAVAATPSPEEYTETPSSLGKAGIRSLETGRSLRPKMQAYIGSDTLADKVKNYVGTAADWVKKNAGYTAATVALMLGSYFIGGVGKVNKSDLEAYVNQQTAALKADNDKSNSELRDEFKALLVKYEGSQKDNESLAQTVKAKDKALADAGAKVLTLIKDADKRVADLKQEYESNPFAIAAKPVAPPKEETKPDYKPVEIVKIEPKVEAPKVVAPVEVVKTEPKVDVPVKETPKAEQKPAEVVDMTPPQAPAAAPAATPVAQPAVVTNEVKTVTYANPGKGRDMTPYWSETEGASVNHEQRIQHLMSEAGIAGLAQEADFRAQYWTSARNFSTPLLAGHGQAAEYNAAVYMNSVAALQLKLKDKTITQEQAAVKLDELVSTLFLRHNEGDIREKQKAVRRYSRSDAVMKLDQWKNTAAISDLLTKSPVDVFKAYDGNKTIKGAKQAAAIARSFDAQMKAYIAEQQFAQLDENAKAKKEFDKDLFFSALWNAKYAADVGVDKQVDNDMKKRLKNAFKSMGVEGKDLEKKVNAFVDTKVVDAYGKKLPGEMRHDILRALYDFAAQTIPGVPGRNADYRRGFDTPNVPDVEKYATGIMTADTLEQLLKLSDKFKPLSYNQSRELARLYGYTLAMHADKIVRDTNGTPTVYQVARVVTDLEKAELVFFAIDESRGNGTKLLKEVRKAMGNEAHDKYDFDRMLAMELAERELIAELEQGQKLVKGVKNATGLDLLNQMRKALQWSILGLQLSGNGIGHPHPGDNGNGGLGGGQTGGPGVGGGGGGGFGGGQGGGPGTGGN